VHSQDDVAERPLKVGSISSSSRNLFEAKLGSLHVGLALSSSSVLNTKYCQIGDVNDFFERKSAALTFDVATFALIIGEVKTLLPLRL
jgi:hypothetical protein